MNPIDYWYQKYLKEKLTAEDVKIIVRTFHKVLAENQNITSDEAYKITFELFNEKRNATEAV